MKNNLLLLRLVLLVPVFFSTDINKISLSNGFSENRAGHNHINILSRWNCYNTVGRKWIFQKMTARESVHETPVIGVFS